MKDTGKKQPVKKPAKGVSDCGGIKSGILSPNAAKNKKPNKK